MRRPLLALALAYLAGIVAAEYLPSVPAFPLLAGGLGLATLAIAWPRSRPTLLWPLLFLAGFANLTQHKASLAPDDLRGILGAKPEIVTLRGTLVETPTHRHYEHRDEEVWRTLARVDVEAIRVRNQTWSPATGRIAVMTPGIVPTNFFGGRRIQIEGVLQPPRSALADGLFDYAAFLSRQGIYYQFDVETISDWRTDDDSAPREPIADRFGRWAKAALALGLPEHDEPLQLLWAMTLGWKTALNGEVSEPFMRSGTMHVFAISGLHIALIASLLVAMLRVFRVPRAWCVWVVVPLIWFYTGVTGWQPSAIRSTIMMTVILGGWLLKRPNDLINSLAGAALIILLWDPQQIFQAGFQLSFAVVFSLALLAPVFHALSAPVLDPSLQANAPLQPGTPLLRQAIDALVRVVPPFGLLFPDPLQITAARPWWQRWLITATRWLAGSIVTSLAAWVGSIPVVAWHFHLLTPVSLLANLLVIPLSSAALACNLASMATAAWLPWATELFNHSAWFFMVWMVKISVWSAELPGGCFHVAAPSLPFFLFYYTALAALMTGAFLKPRLRIATSVALACFAAWMGAAWWHERQFAQLTVLPLNGGEVIYFRPAGGGDELVIDCGNESSAEHTLKPFLRSRGVNRPARLLLTHGDVRNVGGAALMQSRFTPRRVLVSEATFRSGAYRTAVRSFDTITNLVERLPRGARVEPWTLLHPDAADAFPQADDNAAVLHADIFGTRILLLSDLGKPGQNALMTRHPDLRADIVITGLPTQGEPLAEALLDTLQPKLIIVSDSEFPASQRASEILKRRLADRHIPILYTRQSMAVNLRLSQSGWKVSGKADPPHGAEASEAR